MSHMIDWTTLKYNTNDTISIGDNTNNSAHRYNTGGYITSAGSEICFNIVLPKSAVGTTPSFTAGILSVRHSGGGYVFGDTDITTFNSTLVPLDNNTLGVCIKKADGTAFSGATNNTPLGIAGYFTIKF